MTDTSVSGKLAEIIKKSNKIVLFTGAGMSTGSGIPDFRSANGLYNEDSGISVPPEEIISHGFYLSNTKQFFDFYFAKMVYREAKPNPAHLFFAELERQGKLSAVVTQNIDGLHTAAGNKKVYELHGSVYRNYCEDCGKFYSLDETLSKVKKGIPVCDCGGIIKPDVVLYGENLDDGVIDGAIKAISEADTLIIAGTSLAVYPAAGFVGYFKGENLILINKQETPYDKYATLCIHDDIVKISRETAEKL